MNYQIRELKEDDFEDNSFFETLSSLKEIDKKSKNICKEILKELKSSNTQVFVAYNKDFGVMATVRVIWERKFYHEGKKVAHIEDVACHKNYSGKGLASALINHVKSEAKKRNCYKIILDCLDDVAPFYEKNGFSKNAVCMRFDLD